MVFNSLEFALFLCVCLLLTWLLPHRAQNRLLLLASYVFYAAWDWRFLGLIVLSTVIDYTVGLALERSHAQRRRRWLVSASVAANLSILGAFKYAGFFADSLRELAGLAGLELSRVSLDVVLPVGISFYTFQTLSYTIDIYRGRLRPTRHFLDFALFVAFFPQLVAGPIERATNLLPQILAPRRFRWSRFGSGGWLVLWGLFKKVVIADNLAALVDGVYQPGTSPTGPEVLLATYAFAVQIYCDFSGYSDIARGVARLLGFEIMLNFRLPYLAASPAEFWRRWHISLSTWLRDYLYISLGGNRRGRRATYRNLMLTMLLGGLWHGAAWTFVLWGAFHGAWLCVHRILRPGLERLRPATPAGRALWRALCIVVTFQLVCLGWMIFRAESLGHLVALLNAVAVTFEAGRVAHWLLPFGVLVAPLVLMQLAQVSNGRQEVVFGWRLPLRVGLYVLLFFAIVFLGEDFGAPFIYFQF